MSLEDTVRNAAVVAFNVVDSLLQSVTLRWTSYGTHDPNTMRAIDEKMSLTTKMLVEEYDARLIDNISIYPEDRKVTATRAAVLTHPPEPGDTLEFNGKSHTIISVSTIPSQAIYQMQARGAKQE